MAPEEPGNRSADVERECGIAHIGGAKFNRLDDMRQDGRIAWIYDAGITAFETGEHRDTEMHHDRLG
jgi:hypothetical protein